MVNMGSDGKKKFEVLELYFRSEEYQKHQEDCGSSRRYGILLLLLALVLSIYMINIIFSVVNIFPQSFFWPIGIHIGASETIDNRTGLPLFVVTFIILSVFSAFIFVCVVNSIFVAYVLLPIVWHRDYSGKIEYKENLCGCGIVNSISLRTFLTDIHLSLVKEDGSVEPTSITVLPLYYNKNEKTQIPKIGDVGFFVFDRIGSRNRNLLKTFRRPSESFLAANTVGPY